MSTIARTLALSALPALLLCCTPARPTPEAATPTGAAERGALEPAPAVEVVEVADPTPQGGDGAPRLTLAFRFSDGSRKPIGEATAYVAFRRGVALVDLQRRLVLVAPDGARSVLALDAGAPPARGPHGELAYVARHDLTAEVHVLSEDGRDRIVASGLGSAGVLAPQADGRLFFVATRRGGGVAGLWLADGGIAPALRGGAMAETELAAARCLTNCELTTGAPLDERFVPLPREASAIHASAQRVEWEASDGTRRSVALAGELPGESGGSVRDDRGRGAP